MKCGSFCARQWLQWRLAGIIFQKNQIVTVTTLWDICRALLTTIVMQIITVVWHYLRLLMCLASTKKKKTLLPVQVTSCLPQKWFTRNNCYESYKSIDCCSLSHWISLRNVPVNVDSSKPHQCCFFNWSKFQIFIGTKLISPHVHVMFAPFLNSFSSLLLDI